MKRVQSPEPIVYPDQINMSFAPDELDLVIKPQKSNNNQGTFSESPVNRKGVQRSPSIDDDPDQSDDGCDVNDSIESSRQVQVKYQDSNMNE